jgi:hypothetical protein
MSAIIEALRPLLSGFGAGLDQVVFGLSLMLVVLIAPLGILGYVSSLGRFPRAWLASLRDAWTRKRS